MTQFSWPWDCTATGDGGASSFSLDIVEDTNKLLQNITPAISGVVYWTTSPLQNLLEPTNPSGSTIRIATGVGCVEGWLYTNDADVDFDINAAPGNASATDIIVLQRSLAGQTVRLARIGGAASSKAVLTQTAATWEIPIADVVLDGSGNFSSLVDARALAYAPGTVVQIGQFVADGATAAATFSSIPPLFSNLRLVGRARSTTAATTVTATLTLNNDGGANYDWIRHRADSTSTVTIQTGAADTAIDVPTVTGASGTANFFDDFRIVIPAYLTTGYKSILAQYSTYGDGTAFETSYAAGWWRNTGAVNRVDLTLTTFYASGSLVTLYGEV